MSNAGPIASTVTQTVSKTIAPIVKEIIGAAGEIVGEVAKDVAIEEGLGAVAPGIDEVANNVTDSTLTILYNALPSIQDTEAMLRHAAEVTAEFVGEHALPIIATTATIGFTTLYLYNRSQKKQQAARKAAELAAAPPAADEAATLAAAPPAAPPAADEAATLAADPDGEARKSRRLEL